MHMQARRSDKAAAVSEKDALCCVVAEVPFT